MTDMLIFKAESSEEPRAEKISRNLTELQRTDEDQTESSTLQFLEDRGTESSSLKGWPSSQEPVEEPENWMKMEDGRSNDENERGGQLKEEGDGSLADDEEEDDNDDVFQQAWMSEKARQFFTPTVMIVKLAGNQEDLNESSMLKEEIQIHKTSTKTSQNNHMSQPEHVHPQWINDLEKPRDSCCGEVVRLCVFVMAAAVIFPLLTWGGYKLLPFDTPPLDSAPLRLLYTLRAAFFASFPMVLGVLVHGVCRLRFGNLKPLFDGTWRNREVSVHSHYVRESLHLYLLYFLQLAAMATYVQQEMLKLVPLLSIIFVFGRLIYWVSVMFGSSVRALGFSLSFLPLLALLGSNLYFICSAQGQEVVFDVAPPTTAPPPKQRWWG